uniref:Uncharacterized protein n=1 Tax=Phytophthora ramorum TaxID=164328 RepID=H3GY49_PHYRM
MTSSHILLFPEDILQETARFRMAHSGQRCKRRKCDPVEPCERQRAVPADEANGAGEGELLRCPVVTCRQDKFWYGQVVDYDYDHVVVCVSLSDIQTLIVPKDSISEVAPAFCVLLGRAGLAVTNYDDDRLAEMLGVILNRLLGANQSKATRLIGALLSDINDPDELSTGESVVRWVCPQTGTQSTTSIQHVIDFDFYHGGGNRRPRNFKIDDTFYRDPKSAPELTPNSPRSISPPVARQTKHRRVAACAKAAASTNGQGSAPRIRLDEWLRDDESDDNNIGSSEKDKPPPPKRRRAAVDHAVEAMTVAAVADGTVLLRYCVEHLHGSANQLRLLSESYIIPAAAPPDRHATLSDLHECFMVLSMYAEVIFDYHAQRIVSHARSFRDELEDYEGWTPEDIRSVVFWFDFIFEEFRRSAADGISTGRLTLKDHELQGLLYSLQSTKIAAFGSSGERINNQDLTRYVSAI